MDMGKILQTRQDVIISETHQERKLCDVSVAQKYLAPPLSASLQRLQEVQWVRDEDDGRAQASLAVLSVLLRLLPLKKFQC